VNPSNPKPIQTWPPPAPVAQVTREQLKLMSVDAINAAREAGALADIMPARMARK
jgi:hypothetical protein